MEKTCYHLYKIKKTSGVKSPLYSYTGENLTIEDKKEKIKLLLTLPGRKENPGVCRVILYNKEKTPEEYTYLRDFTIDRIRTDAAGMQQGEYALFILYQDGGYLFSESIPLQRNHTFCLLFKPDDIHRSDLISQKLLAWQPFYLSEDEISLSFIVPVLEEVEEDSQYIFTMVDQEPGYDSIGEENTTTYTNKTLYEEIKQLKRMRSNFSDVAFWQPQLVTDKTGTAQFKITFPDNITRWNSVIYAADPTLMTGTARHAIRSFNPIMAELTAPRFLVEGDSCMVQASIRNYMENQILRGNSRFIIRTDSLPETELLFDNFHRQQQAVKALPTDSMTMSYLFTREDGYMDGEQHTIPVVSQGTEIKQGFIKLLSGEETLTLQARPDEILHIKLTGSELDIYLDAMEFLRGYEYACNEQLASKLKGILNFRLYTLSQGNEFTYDQEVNAIIQRLVNNQNSQSLWAWWNNSHEHSGWMSRHSMEALYEARKAGYRFDLKYKPGIGLKDILPENIEWLCMVPKLYGGYEWLEKELANLLKPHATRELTLKQQLLIHEYLQAYSKQWNPDVMKKYIRKHSSGTLYCADNKRNNWYTDELITTAIAYRIIEKEESLQEYKVPLRTYLINTQEKKWNTYQASVILSAILPGFIEETERATQQSKVRLSGKITREITEFPYEGTLLPGEELQINKTGMSTLFCSVYSNRETTEPISTEEFSIRTAFTNGNTLQAGQPVTLNVYVTIHEPRTEHVMIEVPIPAGCSYDLSRSRYAPHESYREHYKEKTVIFAKQLNKCEYHYQIQLIPRFPGEFHLNPGKISLMYFPHICATTGMRKVRIQ
ncbi:MAG: hypothetical protein LIP01_00640 [Tannerellaceae bacterium]|nr:hypothetical protein [Tannerellaceae bacterium]